MASSGRLRLAVWLVVVMLLAASSWIGWMYGRVWFAANPHDTTMTLRVNFERQIDVVPSTPLLFEVTLTGDGSRFRRIGDRERPWPALVRLVRAGSDERAPWPASQLGPASSIHVASGARRLRLETSDGTAMIERGRINKVVFALSPEQTATAASGTYQIQAVLEQGFWPPWRWHGRIASAPVTITVHSSRNNERQERERLFLSANYFLFAGRRDDAHRAALELSKRDATDPAIAMLLGDTLAASGRTSDALTAYRTALAHSPRAYEAPLAIYERIAGLSR